MALGMLVLQIGWTLTIPAFGGIDEFDHAYRAAAVARGEWAPPPADATRGTGAWVHVPADIVDAARAQCRSLKYTKDADCVGTRSGDTVRIASGAGRYNPLFYALIGYPAAPFHGRAALYVMRAVTAIMCTALFGLGFVALRRWARNRWVYACAVAGLTPVLMYSTAIASPNGFEMAAAFAFWSALIGLFVAKAPDSPGTRWLVVIATVAGVLLLTVRSLGPLWCALIVLTTMVAVPGSVIRLISLLRTRAFLVGLAALVVSGAASLLWIEKMRTLVVGTHAPTADAAAHKVSSTLGYVPLWLFQSIAAFPFRGQPSPALVYVAVLAIAGTFLLVAIRHATTRTRIALAVVVFLSTAVPFGISVRTVDDYAGAWQGRYGLPYSLGLLVLCGLILNDSRKPPRPLLVVLAAAASAVATVLAEAHVVDIERDISPSLGSGAWHPPSLGMLIVLGIVGSALLWSVAASGSAREEEASRVSG